eukprot:RCo045587
MPSDLDARMATVVGTFRRYNRRPPGRDERKMAWDARAGLLTGIFSTTSVYVPAEVEEKLKDWRPTQGDCGGDSMSSKKSGFLRSCSAHDFHAKTSFPATLTSYNQSYSGVWASTGRTRRHGGPTTATLAPFDTYPEYLCGSPAFAKHVAAAAASTPADAKVGEGAAPCGSALVREAAQASLPPAATTPPSSPPFPAFGAVGPRTVAGVHALRQLSYHTRHLAGTTPAPAPARRRRGLGPSQ